MINCEPSLINMPIELNEERAQPRKIAANPYRVLDAPGLQDDFYLNLVDWSA